jgi:hypothetical protein
MMSQHELERIFHQTQQDYSILSTDPEIAAIQSAHALGRDPGHGAGDVPAR